MFKIKVKSNNDGARIMARKNKDKKSQAKPAAPLTLSEQLKKLQTVHAKEASLFAEIQANNGQIQILLNKIIPSARTAFNPNELRPENLKKSTNSKNTDTNEAERVQKLKEQSLKENIEKLKIEIALSKKDSNQLQQIITEQLIMIEELQKLTNSSSNQPKNNTQSKQDSAFKSSMDDRRKKMAAEEDSDDENTFIFSDEEENAPKSKSTSQEAQEYAEFLESIYTEVNPSSIASKIAALKLKQEEFKKQMQQAKQPNATKTTAEPKAKNTTAPTPDPEQRKRAQNVFAEMHNQGKKPKTANAADTAKTKEAGKNAASAAASRANDIRGSKVLTKLAELVYTLCSQAQSALKITKEISNLLNKFNSSQITEILNLAEKARAAGQDIKAQLQEFSRFVQSNANDNDPKIIAALQDAQQIAHAVEEAATAANAEATAARAAVAREKAIAAAKAAVERANKSAPQKENTPPNNSPAATAAKTAEQDAEKAKAEAKAAEAAASAAAAKAKKDLDDAAWIKASFGM